MARLNRSKVDTTLSYSGMAADAAVVGQAFKDEREYTDTLASGKLDAVHSRNLLDPSRYRPGWFAYVHSFVIQYHADNLRYKILGYRINFEGETLYVFDLLVPEIFHESQKRKKGESAPQSEETKPVNTRKGFYPDDIAGTFGVPVEEHLKESEVKQIDGYVSMSILTGKAPGTSAD